MRLFIKRLLCQHPYFAQLTKPVGSRFIVCVRCGREW